MTNRLVKSQSARKGSEKTMANPALAYLRQLIGDTWLDTDVFGDHRRTIVEIRDELATRCKKTGTVLSEWVQKFRLASMQTLLSPEA